MLEKNRIHSPLPVLKSPFSLLRGCGCGKPQQRGDGSQAGTAGVWPLEAAGSTGQGQEPLPAGCDTLVTSPVTRSGSCPPLPQPGCRVWCSVCGCARHRTCSPTLGGGSHGLGHLPREQTAPHLPLPSPSQPPSFPIIHLWSSCTIAPWCFHPSCPCATGTWRQGRLSFRAKTRQSSEQGKGRR